MSHYTEEEMRERAAQMQNAETETATEDNAFNPVIDAMPEETEK